MGHIKATIAQLTNHILSYFRCIRCAERSKTESTKVAWIYDCSIAPIAARRCEEMHGPQMVHAGDLGFAAASAHAMHGMLVGVGESFFL